MVRELIIPTTNDFYISIPNEYIGRQVEFIIFALDEVKNAKEEKDKHLEYLSHEQPPHPLQPILPKRCYRATSKSST